MSIQKKKRTKKNVQATYVNHMLVVMKPYDKEQYDSLQDTQIKVIYITVKEG